ncbi:MAG: hypothetical protein COU07_01700 [Candidatus Harrisonbacteria bacterium CG10_big_fil_rev_8_21_14_0_10_40_38]|uniref:Uncharacterized protein n=1 Tax=Candidatus Harrisonbacteria bacterium CG10_big_fil_rev_8_21_14_0_10_40_38 TaxID=1974583 RepID=A0A2H0UT78_9BACT|nr:MAG: hypothetical protein COU07_01700 [Candidatus Harrisonbacteria bacterium CG10_big_fil_rev_8_21_14_0_10_40_38]
MNNQQRKIEDILNEVINLKKQGLDNDAIINKIGNENNEIISLLKLVEELSILKNSISAPKTSLEKIIKDSKKQKTETPFFKNWKLALPMAMAVMLIFIVTSNNNSNDETNIAPAINTKESAKLLINDDDITITNIKNNPSSASFRAENTANDSATTNEEESPSPTPIAK